MAVGDRIKKIRKLRGFTQKELGMKVGFAENTADVRMAQYESGTRKPKEKLISKIAYILEINPDVLNVPNIDNYQGLAHTLFALEDLYGIKINNDNGAVYLDIDKSRTDTYSSMFSILNAWAEENKKLKAGEITEEEYDDWRYNYPKSVADRDKTSRDDLQKERKNHE